MRMISHVAACQSRSLVAAETFALYLAAVASVAEIVTADTFATVASVAIFVAADTLAAVAAVTSVSGHSCHRR